MRLIGTRERTAWTSLALLGCCATALAAMQLAGCQDYGGYSQQQPLQQQSSTGGGGNHLFSRFMAPFRATLDQARQMIQPNGGQAAQPADAAGAASGWQQRLAGLRTETFKMFARIYNKTYSADELPKRMRLFFARRREIEESVRAYAEGRLPFMMRENVYADWDKHELRQLTGVTAPRTLAELLPEERQAIGASPVGNQRQTKTTTTTTRALSAMRRFKRSISFVGAVDQNNATQMLIDDDDDADDDDDLEMSDWRRRSANDDDDQDDGDPDLVVMAPERVPASKDWRASGCVSAPINQMKCGACYAIATMSVIETMRCLKSATAPVLSPQHIVDCATPRAGYQNFGCNGGWPTRVLRYLQDAGVAVRDSCYPFVRRQNGCRLAQLRSSAPNCLINASPSDGNRLTYKVLNNERDILYHVARTGPVVTVMRATDKFLYYGSGIFDDPSCTRRRDDVDHAIVIVGYGRENGQDYWLIKNSWGTREWGQMGYGKYRRGTNACSIGHWGWVVTS